MRTRNPNLHYDVTLKLDPASFDEMFNAIEIAMNTADDNAVNAWNSEAVAMYEQQRRRLKAILNTLEEADQEVNGGF
jgi:hypothetical protein